MLSYNKFILEKVEENSLIEVLEFTKIAFQDMEDDEKCDIQEEWKEDEGYKCINIYINLPQVNNRTNDLEKYFKSQEDIMARIEEVRERLQKIESYIGNKIKVEVSEIDNEYVCITVFGEGEINGEDFWKESVIKSGDTPSISFDDAEFEKYFNLPKRWYIGINVDNYRLQIKFKDRKELEEYLVSETIEKLESYKINGKDLIVPLKDLPVTRMYRPSMHLAEEYLVKSKKGLNVKWISGDHMVTHILNPELNLGFS